MSDSVPVTVWITRTVKPGCEAAFERAMHEFAQRSLMQPGQLGVHITRPPPGAASREYRIMRKFAGRAELASYRTSSEYLAWNEAVRALTEGEPRIEELSGLESWYTPDGAPLRPLPQWKMALVTFLGVYPLTSLLPPIFGKLLSPLHPLLINIAATGLIVVLLTWVVMPLLTRIFHRWLSS